MSMSSYPYSGDPMPKKQNMWNRFNSFMFGDKDKFSQMGTYTPGQQQGLEQIMQQLGIMGQQGGAYGQSQNYLQDMLGGDQQSYERFAAPFRTQFEQQTIPGLSERFAGLGGGMGGGVMGSSGFGQAIGGAGAQFQSNLSNLYAQLRQQAAQSAMGQYNQMANMGLGARSFETMYQPGSTGLVGAASTAAAGAAGKAGTVAMMA